MTRRSASNRSRLATLSLAVVLGLGAPAFAATEVPDPSQEPVVRAVSLVMPAVVNIHAERTVQRPFIARYFRQYYYGSENVPVPSLGSGLLVSPEGHIVTNYHVVSGAEELTKLQVTLSDGTTYDADYLRGSETADLALIKIHADGPFPHYDLAHLSKNHLGQTVIALGNPVGYQNSVSRGILSAVDRTFESEGESMSGLVQTDAAINPGNSGGPLIDIAGKLVGLNTAKFAAVEVEGLSFAIPGETVAKWVVEAVAIARGQKDAPPVPVSLAGILRERFGLVLEDVTPDLSRQVGFRPGSGLYVREVEAGSPASVQRVRPGMLLIGIGAVAVYDAATLPREISGIKTGDTLQFNVMELERRGAGFRQRTGRVLLTAR